MSEPNPLNDPELERLERRLGHVAWLPTVRERERWLYACGQAAGRAQMMRRVRGATAAAMMLSGVCAGLSAALLHRDESPIAAIKPEPPRSFEDSAIAPPRDLPRETRRDTGDRKHELSVSTGFAELSLFDRVQPTSQAHDTTSESAHESILRASGPVSAAL